MPEEPFAVLIREGWIHRIPRWIAKTLGDASILLTSAVCLLARRIGFRAKQAYVLRLSGEQLSLPALAEGLDAPRGFYTTRWVMARSREEAIARATAVVRADLERLGQSAHAPPPNIEIEACVRLEGYVRRRGGGFGFWSQED
jgi:hypothetical protein